MQNKIISCAYLAQTRAINFHSFSSQLGLCHVEELSPLSLQMVLWHKLRSVLLICLVEDWSQCGKNTQPATGIQIY